MSTQLRIAEGQQTYKGFGCCCCCHVSASLSHGQQACKPFLAVNDSCSDARYVDFYRCVAVENGVALYVYRMPHYCNCSCNVVVPSLTLALRAMPYPRNHIASSLTSSLHRRCCGGKAKSVANSGCTCSTRKCFSCCGKRSSWTGSICSFCCRLCR